MERLQSERIDHLRVLLVDPREDIRAALARRLRADARVGHVVEVADAREALELLDSVSPNVVLIDPGAWHGGGRDALFTLAEARRRSGWFVIALHVAYRGRPDAVEAQGLGADVFILKGLRTGDLIFTLTGHVGGMSTED